ncbi:MAG: signal peptide peptidase SppA [Alphaproteobacteria bacterium]|nr:signal peptide peptidase SppA [Alphaproteobacteria bacterium]
MAILGAILRWIFSIFANAFKALLTIVVMVMIIAFLSGFLGAFSGATLPGRMLLTLDARQGFLDQPQPAAFPGFGEQRPSAIDTVLALAKAENDDRVRGLFIRLGSGGISYGHVEELREAIKSFRAKGKFVIVHAQSFASNGLADYYLASSADAIWLQPGSEVDAAGVASYTPFLRGLFDKIDATPQLAQREEYKSAADMFMQSDYTPAHREATTRLITSIYENAVAGIADGRDMAPPAVKALLEAAPHTAADAVAAKLVDQLGYDDDALAAAKDEANGAEPTSLWTYFESEGGPYAPAFGGAAVVALVNGDGQIVEGKGGPDPFGGEAIFGGDTVAQAIRDATEDEDVKAILFRVNSPGGSAIASDQVLDAVKKARAAGKIVIVSMGSVAASGGYYVAAAADRIFALPSTLTGSIGVVYGKVATGGTYALLGINIEGVAVGGPAATMQNSVDPYTPEQLAAIQRMIDQVYGDFLNKVAEGRDMSVARVRQIARGRVWTGADAKPLGLVDEFGGLRAALSATREMLGLTTDAEIELRTFPHPKSPLEALAEMFGGASSAMQVLVSLRPLLESDAAYAILHAVSTEPGDARMPPQQLR